MQIALPWSLGGRLPDQQQAQTQRMRKAGGTLDVLLQNLRPSAEPRD
jgi:hypothetical protein